MGKKKWVSKKSFALACLLQILANSFAVVQDGAGIIEKFVAQYTRPFTLLEISATASPYDLMLTRRQSGTHIVMMQQGAERIVNQITKNNIASVAVVNPEEISNPLLERLGHCEHFDMVVVHDFAALGNHNIFNVMRLLLKLGTHIFVELPQTLFERYPEALPKPEILARSAHEALCYFHVDRTDLRLPRWDAGYHEKRAYQIQSSFSEKSLYKPLTGTSAAWIPGINLITFIMTRGIYPTDKMIRKQLRAFERIDHNDLVVGNIVVQGAHLAPIDFGDRRRNADINLHVKAALKIFRFGRRFNNAEKTMRMYRDYIAENK